MKTLINFFILVLLFSITNSYVFAQAGGPGSGSSSEAKLGSLSGKLIDDKNQPISYATVTLLRIDSGVVNGDLTKDDGTFRIGPVSMGTFRLRIESIGVTTKYLTVAITADTPDKNMGNIKIAASETTLKTVNIVGEKTAMELKVDKKVFNVEKNITSAGGNATDVLQNVPSVSVDVDGNVSLRGKSGVTILIDGKPATLLGSDVTSALQSLPASSIENVEVISNPSAKYDASGTTGIINIVTKKDGRLGINGNLTLGAGTRDKYNGNFGLNVRKGKWTAFMNSSLRINNTFNDVITDRKDMVADANGNTKSYHTFEHVPRHFNGSFNSIGATYDPNKYNSFTITENINKMGFGYNDYSVYSVYNNPNQAGSAALQQTRYSIANGGPFSVSSAIDYKHKFKKKDEELSIDGTYAVTTVSRENSYHTYNDNYAGIDPNYHIYQSAPGSGGNSTFNAWADYTNPMLTKNGKFGAGVKTQLYWFNSHNTPIIDSVVTGKEVVDSALLIRYDYTQQIHAAYVNWSDQLDKFSYQLGLRAEDAEYSGTNEGREVTKLKNSFFNFFPSAFVSYQMANQQSIYLNYSRRTNRPNFFQLLPYKDLSNPSTVSTGNPALDPEFIDNIEFSYNRLDKKGNNLIFSAYFQYTQNLIERFVYSDPANYGDRLVSMPKNLASGTTYGVEAIGNLKLTKIWDATLSANVFKNELTLGNAYAGSGQTLSDRSGYGSFAKLNTTVKLPKSFSIQINGNYESPKIVAQGKVRETYWFDLAVRKNLLKGKATIVVNCSDIFKTHRFINDYDFGYFTQTINRVKETRIGNITFTYRFGKTEFGKDIASGNAGGKRKPEEMKPKDTKKQTQPNGEDRGKNLKESDDNDQGGSGQGGNQGGGGGQKGK